MAFSSGTFSLYSPGNPVVTGTTIASTWANNTLNDIATGLSTCLLKDGTQTVTANIPMGNFKFTGLGAGSASGNSLRYEQVNGVVTTAGDLLYATGAGVLARLALGTAGQALYTNSGATAPAWGNSFKIVTTTFDMSSASNTNLVITGVGFKPRAVILLEASTAGAGNHGSVGWSDGTTDFAISNDNANGAGTWTGSSVGCLFMIPSAGTSQTLAIASGGSFDADGCTLKNTKAGAAAGTANISVLFLR